MFKAKSNRSRDASAHSPASGKRGMFSVIGPDVTIVGNVTATADLHIDGQVEGDVQCGTLVQSAGSRITGNLTAGAARIAGSIDGRVSVRQLTVERGARITGDVEYEDIAIENGATVDGHLHHQPADALTLADAPTPINAKSEQLMLQGGVAA